MVVTDELSAVEEESDVVVGVTALIGVDECLPSCVALPFRFEEATGWLVPR
jgi:hypothetical protein